MQLLLMALHPRTPASLHNTVASKVQQGNLDSYCLLSDLCTCGPKDYGSIHRYLHHPHLQSPIQTQFHLLLQLRRPLLVMLLQLPPPLMLLLLPSPPPVGDKAAASPIGLHHTKRRGEHCACMLRQPVGEPARAPGSEGPIGKTSNETSGAATKRGYHQLASKPASYRDTHPLEVQLLQP